jgi:hypothetical protein
MRVAFLQRFVGDDNGVQEVLYGQEGAAYMTEANIVAFLKNRADIGNQGTTKKKGEPLVPVCHDL